ncbi:hypothetical protein QY049_03930 [Bradyrhizobium sp. WYCCWR 13022]|uniref:hypothetical protein n=1 Tax=unclassified Bradyrhizobium TaxID=2631580 RepID=UPI00263A4F42|nr:hypothetical protein [Bradyrhizobium sp. WYCCWR 13022]MDN4982372.1 hypothetical protein [Bradyrhizobium sp. WYCCWR 13022]
MSASAASDDLLAAHEDGVPIAAIAKMEDRLAITERRISSLKSAIADHDRKLTDAQAELDEHLAHEAAERAAAELERDHAAFATKLNALVTDANELLPLATKLRATMFTASEIENLARAIGAEVPTAARRLADEVRYTVELIKRERPAKFVKVDRAA